MKAILIEKDTNALSWSDVPNPVVGPEDALVEIHAAALNRADLMQRAGDYPPPPGCPEWMGLEIAGVIVELGEEAKKKSSWKIGDKVCALLGGGGYAEYANVKYDMLMPVPETCTFEEAAAIPEAFATAYLNLRIPQPLHRGRAESRRHAADARRCKRACQRRHPDGEGIRRARHHDGHRGQRDRPHQASRR